VLVRNSTFIYAIRRGANDAAYSAAMPETKVPFRIRPLTIVALAGALVLIVVAVVYLTMSHPKHALLFFGLAVLALVGAWFSTGESRLRP